MSDNKDELDQDNKGTTSFGTFEEYLATTDEPIQELYRKHTSGLTSALDKERGARKGLEQQMKELLPKAEKGSELEKALTEKIKELEDTSKKFVDAERRAKFAETANSPKVGCTNIKAAYTLAAAEGLFDEDENPKWDDLKKLAPELFKTSGTDGGNHGDPILDNDINAAIRRAAKGRM